MARSTVFGDLSERKTTVAWRKKRIHGMDADAGKPLAAYGFLTIVETAEHGFFGGYLVLSVQGRPLEFRCSAPVVPRRAQEILYGPTLRPFLYAEVIGAELVASATFSVRAILVDSQDSLPLGLLRGEPVFCVQDADDGLDAGVQSDQGADECRAADRSKETPQREAREGAVEETFIAGRRLTTASGCEHHLLEAAALLAALATHIDLAEPFERIRAALAEAQAATPEAEGSADDVAAAA